MASPSTQTAGHPQTEKTSPRDFRQEVTDSIIQMLERGVAPWQKPWEPGAGSLSMPFNPTSERAYRGGNAIHLMAAGLRNGFDDPRLMTYKQAAAVPTATGLAGLLTAVSGVTKRLSMAALESRRKSPFSDSDCRFGLVMQIECSALVSYGGHFVKPLIYN